MLIPILSLYLSSNKLGNNFNCDTNLLTPKFLLLISNKKMLSCYWLATNDNFWCWQQLKKWISRALFEQRRFSFVNFTNTIFWTKGELVYKYLLIRSVLKSQYQNPWNLDDSLKNNFKFLMEQRNRLNILLHRLLGRSLVGIIEMIWDYIN